MAPRPFRTSSSTAAGSDRSERASDPRPDPPSPIKPWHLAQTPRSLAELPRAGALCCAPLREPGGELGFGHDLDRGEHLRVLEPAQLGALAREPPVSRPGTRSRSRSGNRVDLAPERRNPPRVDDVRVRAVTARRTGTPASARIVSIAITPFGYSNCQCRLAPDDGDLELPLPPDGMSLMPGSSMKTNAPMRNRTTTGTPSRQARASSRRAPALRALEARSLLAAVADDEGDQEALDENEDPDDEDRDEEEAVADSLGVRRLGRHWRESVAGHRRRRQHCREQRESDKARSAPDAILRRAGGRVPRTRVRLPADVVRPFRVFVNGVQQEEGTDFRVEGRTLLFFRELKSEGKLGFWRWMSMWVGVAGTCRQNDSVDVAYQRSGKPVVAAKLPSSRSESRLAAATVERWSRATTDRGRGLVREYKKGPRAVDGIDISVCSG